MLMKCFLGLCLCLLIFVSGHGQSNFQFNKNKKSVSIPFQLINNLIFIPVTLNGETLTFLLDTGVEQTLLFSLDDKEKVSLFYLEKINIGGLGSNKAIEAYKSSQNKMECNGYIDESHELYLVLDQDFNFSSQVGIPVNGIIGYNFFKDYPVEINYEKKKVIVHSSLHKKLKKKLERNFTKDTIAIEDHKPYYVSNVVTNGTAVYPSKLLLDTGNSDAIWLFKNKFSPASLPQKTIDDFLGRGFSGNVYGQRGRISSFVFGAKTFENPIGTFPDSTSVNTATFVFNRSGSLGGEVFTRFTVVFDYPNGKLYTKPNATVTAPFNFNMSGIEVQHDGLEWVKETYDDTVNKGKTFYNGYTPEARLQDNLKIKFVLKPVFRIYTIRIGSPAALSGLKSNDKIIAINRQKTNNLSIEKINELLKSEDGKTIEIEVERNAKVFRYTFQLKKII